MAARSVLRQKFFLLVLILTMIPAVAQAATRTIMGKEYGITGVRIAKSSSARLANLDDPALVITRRSVYLPAGTRLLVLRHVRADSRGRRWGLTVTEDGLLVYVRVDRNEHYFPHRGIEQSLRAGKPIAFVTTTTRATSERYGLLTLTPSEAYDFEYLDGDGIRLTVGKSKMTTAYTTDDTVDIDIANVAIVQPGDMDPATIPDPFQPYGTKDHLQDIFANAKDLSLDQEDRDRIEDYLEARFVTKKSCLEVRDLSRTVDAEAEVDFGGLLSPVAASLGISGSYSSKMVFEKGVGFTVTRYIRDGKIAEIKSEIIDEECTSNAPRQRVIASDGTGGKARIRTGAAEEIGLSTTVEGLPIYTCRSEYDALHDMLSLEQTLDTPLATFLIARFAVFKGAATPASCSGPAV